MTVSFFQNRLLAGLVALLMAVAGPLSGGGGDAQAAPPDEAANYIVLEDDWSEDAQRMLALTEGPMNASYFFAYKLDQEYRSMKLCCDTYVNGEKTEESVLFEHAFAESQPDMPREGEIYIGCYRQYISFTELTYRRTVLLDEAGKRIGEEDEPTAQTLWDEGTFPQLPEGAREAKYQRLFHSFFPGVETPDDALPSGNITPGARVNLLLYGEAQEQDEESFYGKAADYTRLSAEEVLKDPAQVGENSFFLVFYCVFE